MSGVLLFPPVFRAVDASGEPINGAGLQFYLTGTTTPTPVYTDDTRGTPLSNPVIADSGGLFAPIYLDPAVTYRAQLLDAASTIIADVDPIAGTVVAATQAQVNAGVATGVYVTPATLAAWTGLPTALGFTPVNKAGDTATNLALAFTALLANSAGYLGAPVNEQDANYVLALSDAGKMVRANAAERDRLHHPAQQLRRLPGRDRNRAAQRRGRHGDGDPGSRGQPGAGRGRDEQGRRFGAVGLRHAGPGNRKQLGDLGDQHLMTGALLATIGATAVGGGAGAPSAMAWTNVFEDIAVAKPIS